MPVRACPERRKVITATDEQNGMKGQTRAKKKTDKGEKNARRRPRATEVKHNTKKNKKKHTNKN